MEHFVVSARKYRPTTFRSVVGQSHITTTLKNAIARQHLAQAFLFCGPRGVGKTTCARILAKTINCQQLTPEHEACGVCESCRSFQQQQSFNVHELDAASHNSVDDIRNLTEQVRYPPQTGRYKVYIIDEVHMLSNAAFNAFLKTLEEPPSYAIFILATTEKHRIIPTILSRCQIFDFNRIQPGDIVEHLRWIADQEGIAAEEEALRLIAQKADGGLRDALSTFDMLSTFAGGGGITYPLVIEQLHILDYDYYFRLTAAALEGQTAQALLLFDEVLRRGFDGHLFIVGLAGHLRDLLVCQDAATLPLLEVSAEVQARYRAQAARASTSFLLTALQEAHRGDQQYKAAKNPRLHVELCLLRICHLPQAIRLAELVQLPATAEAPALSVEPSAEVAEKKSEYRTTVAEASSSVVLPTAPSVRPPATPPVAANGHASGTSPQTAAVADKAPPRPPGLQTMRLPDFRAAVAAPPVGAAAAPAVEAESPAPSAPVTAERLAAVWPAVARTLAERSPMLHGLTATWQAPDRVSVELDNDYQLEHFARREQGFCTEQLRQQLDAPNLRVEAQLRTGAAVAPKIFTATQRFEQWAAQNPVLNEFKTRLGLEIDY